MLSRQFRLRTALLGMTLVCVIVASAHSGWQAYARQKKVARVRELVTTELATSRQVRYHERDRVYYLEANLRTPNLTPRRH
jgi:hypothetical protein